MAELLNNELNDTSAFAEGAIEHMSQHTTHVTPEMVSVRASWKKGKIAQDAPEPIVAPDASTSSGSGGQHPTIPTPHGGPSAPAHQPFKKSHVATHGSNDND
jgi:hypothetical protein